MLEIIISALFSGRYVAIFLGSIIEGPVIMTATGFFIKMGVFKILPAYLLLILGDLVADTVWYFIGYFSANKPVKKLSKFLGLSDEKIEKISQMFKNHESKILFLSKITMGFGFSLATLMTAGALRVKFWKYLFLNFLGGLIWVGFLLCLGYFLGNIYMLVAEGLQIAFIVIALLIFIFIMHRLSKYWRKNI